MLSQTRMRTTITLDPDVHTALNEAAFRSGRSFKTTVNDALRAGLSQVPLAHRRPTPPQWPVFDMGAPLIDLNKANALAAELEDRDVMAKLAKGA